MNLIICSNVGQRKTIKESMQLYIFIIIMGCILSMLSFITALLLVPRYQSITSREFKRGIIKGLICVTDVKCELWNEIP